VPDGQCLTGWMSDPDCATRDPIFWLLHSNIDRLWKRRLDLDGHADPFEAAWLDGGSGSTILPAGRSGR
jgi:hypothetical protein